MQGQNQQQAYDRGITIFSPDGRLYQVEYAREAVKRGSASIGIRTPEGVVLAAERRSRSSLMERDSVEKLHKIDDHIGIASAGHVADARQLIDMARRQAQVNQLRYGETIGVETLTKHVTDHIQQYTQTGGARPFGVALLVGGVEDGEPRLFETDPSGTPYEWKAIAIGGNREEIQRHLEDHYEEDMSLQAAVDLAIESLAVGEEDGFPAEGLAISTVETETGEYRSLEVDEIANRLRELDLLTEGEEEE
ncbi:archaeal proteasome endopeptidase complex subunit alpha [Haloarchaeobius sp. HRN-SO-5]|uniref:archaeal proteasome endopeptidase complex subunit alpha n=1 Tax=Haloarchaeobius sp. HRN-SO-5 TaxID=3446118 RepID=UPI003EBC0BA0